MVVAVGAAGDVLKGHRDGGGLFQRLEKFLVPFHSAGQFFHADRGRWLALGLAYIKDGHDFEGRNLDFLYLGDWLSILAYHHLALGVQLRHFLLCFERGRGQDLDGFFAFLHIAVKLVPPLIVARYQLAPA